ncbi:DUF7389 domain-containing protein [Haloarchaeobius sp. DFWS5]|uniref:DUF7389 domain-containing protein n=1 Tax=Haloarchaeobius sp. DFWS5 TaxID=3446114 RepID=UPI003EB8F9D8
MSSANAAPESDEESRHEKTGAPEPRKVATEKLAKDQCIFPNSDDDRCKNDSIPGMLVCPDHAGMALEAAGSDDETPDIDGVVLATTGATNLRYRLEADDDAILHPVDDDGQPVSMTWHELACVYNSGEMYIPDRSDVSNFGRAVSSLATTNYAADARDPIEAETDRGEVRTDGGRDFDTREKVERTDTGYRLTVESKRGTGTRDEDKVKAELRTEEWPSREQINSLTTDVAHVMERRREHQPDEDGDDE